MNLIGSRGLIYMYLYIYIDVYLYYLIQYKCSLSFSLVDPVGMMTFGFFGSKMLRHFSHLAKKCMRFRML